MTGPTDAQRREIEDLEHHIATIHFLLDVLRIGLSNARTPQLAKRLDREIARQVERVAELKARRDALARQLGGKGRR